MKKLVLWSLAFLSLMACSTTPDAQAKTKLEIMSYNVENLFDTVHDEGKNDWTFLPSNTKGKKAECEKIGYHRYRKSCFNINWTKKHLDMKLEQIKEVITKGRDGLPDILALSEIENANVVGMLAKKLGYENFEVSDSPDKRGVDLALLWKSNSGLSKTDKREHVIKGDYFKKKPTRNILEVSFKLNGKHPITIFVNHWPSLGNPTSTRLVAANTLRDRIQELQKENKGQNIIALGDFNTIPTNFPHPFKSVLEKDGALIDVHEKYRSDRKIHWKEKNKMPLGSYFYGRSMTWNLLDRVFVNGNLMNKTGLDLVLKSYQIYAPKFITKEYEYQKKDGYNAGTVVKGTPKRYSHESTSVSKLGYSDHFPLVFELRVL